MFVFYLDECNTALWKVFGVSLLLIALMATGFFGLKLLASHGDRKSLERAGITGSTYEKLKPKVGNRATHFGVSAAALAIILACYVATFTNYSCTPDSILWTG